uniref:Uncharacterized protein n=1 Tax=Arundo donax TaxID=35708 RepID=A0A0A9B1M4_ARUDO
MELIRYYRLG